MKHYNSNKSGHFYNAVSNWKGQAHHALQDLKKKKEKSIHQNFKNNSYVVITLYFSCMHARARACTHTHTHTHTYTTMQCGATQHNNTHTCMHTHTYTSAHRRTVRRDKGIVCRGEFLMQFWRHVRIECDACQKSAFMHSVRSGTCVQNTYS